MNEYFIFPRPLLRRKKTRICSQEVQTKSLWQGWLRIAHATALAQAIEPCTTVHYTNCGATCDTQLPWSTLNARLRKIVKVTVNFHMQHRCLGKVTCREFVTECRRVRPLREFILLGLIDQLDRDVTMGKVTVALTIFWIWYIVTAVSCLRHWSIYVSFLIFYVGSDCIFVSKEWSGDRSIEYPLNIQLSAFVHFLMQLFHCSCCSSLIYCWLLSCHAMWMNSACTCYMFSHLNLFVCAIRNVLKWWWSSPESMRRAVFLRKEELP